MHSASEPPVLAPAGARRHAARRLLDALFDGAGYLAGAVRAGHLPADDRRLGRPLARMACRRRQRRGVLVLRRRGLPGDGACLQERRLRARDAAAGEALAACAPGARRRVAGRLPRWRSATWPGGRHASPTRAGSSRTWPQGWSPCPCGFRRPASWSARCSSSSRCSTSFSSCCAARRRRTSGVSRNDTRRATIPPTLRRC